MNIKNHTSEIKTQIHYEDVNNIVYNATVFVTVTSKYEINAFRFGGIKSYDKNDDPCKPEMIPKIREQLETLAGIKALEKVQPVDFDRDDERE